MRRLLVVLVLLGGGAGCAGDDGGAQRATTDRPTTTTTAAAPATTATTTGAGPPTTAAAPVTTAPPPPPPSTAPTAAVVPRGVSGLPAGSPTSVAEALAEAEPGLRAASTPPAELERLGQAQQVAYRQLVANPGWLDDVLARLPASLHAIVRANVRAGSELRALTKPQSALPPWRIVAPAPAEELLRYYKEAQAATGVPWAYLAAIHLTETRMGRIRGTSTAGAQGPMQFLPATWSQYGEGDINSNRDSIMAAARYLKRNGAPGDMANALFNYNRSQRYVTAVTEYAQQMEADEGAYRGYYHWQVYYRLVDGDRLLAVGYGS